MKTIFSGVFFAACGLALSTNAALAASSSRPTYLFGEGYGVKNADRGFIKMDSSFGARVGYGRESTATAGFELGVFYNTMAAKRPHDDGHQEGAVLDLYKYLTPSIYVIGGVGYVRDSIAYIANSPAVELGIGYKRPLNDKWRFRMSVVAQDDFNTKFDESGYIDLRANFGLDYLQTKAAPPPPPPPPPPVDTDGDGVADGIDKCPDRAAATADGCPAPVDTDGDGLTDDKDQCPDRAASTPDGCPLPPPPVDADSDGVMDNMDKCLGTLAGLKTDESGCVMHTTAKQATILKGVSFLPSSAELEPDAITILDLVAESLANQADLKVEVAGYTDTSGNPEVNMRLSKERAEKVRKYLVGKGIDAARLTAKGYGPANPIADNKTFAGRVQNRRVELKVLQ